MRLSFSIRSSIQPIIDQQLNTKKSPKRLSNHRTSNRKLEKRLMHGYNNTEPFTRRTPKRYTYTKNSCVVTITDVNDAPPKHNPALLTRFHFPVLILLSRIATPPFWFLFFQVFPPPLLVFLSMFPAFTGLLLPPQSNALCLSPPLFSLAHLPFQLPAGMHVTSPFLSRQTGMRQCCDTTRCHFIPNTSASSPFLLPFPPLSLLFSFSSSLLDSMHVPVSYK